MLLIVDKNNSHHTTVTLHWLSIGTTNTQQLYCSQSESTVLTQETHHLQAGMQVSGDVPCFQDADQDKGRHSKKQCAYNTNVLSAAKSYLEPEQNL